MCWLQGKHPKNKSDPAYIGHRLRQYHIKENHGPLHGPGIDEFLGSVVDKKADLHRKIALLAMGPDKAFPWTLEHYWLFYKYLLRDLPYLEDEMLPDFDKYWPNEQMGRPYKRFKGLGDAQWSSYGGRHAAEMKVHDTCDTIHPEDKASDKPQFSKMHNAPMHIHRPVIPPDSPADPESSAAPAGAPVSAAPDDATEHTTVSTVPIVPVDANAPEILGPVPPPAQAPPPEVPVDPSPPAPEAAVAVSKAQVDYDIAMGKTLVKMDEAQALGPSHEDYSKKKQEVEQAVNELIEMKNKLRAAKGKPPKATQEQYEEAVNHATAVVQEVDAMDPSDPAIKEKMTEMDKAITQVIDLKVRLDARKGKQRAK